mmetsp:Transcript_97337/g.203209  ORF Transcript_97337/g.203209 Transcript_97337/m.203209 type:complete len:81 (-) Transcript_97337:77-319(-)
MCMCMFHMAVVCGLTSPRIDEDFANLLLLLEPVGPTLSVLISLRKPDLSKPGKTAREPRRPHQTTNSELDPLCFALLQQL